MGRLPGKYSKANPPPSGRYFSNVNMDELEPLLEYMRKLAEKYNVSVSSVALNYVICKGIRILLWSMQNLLVFSGVIPLGGARDGKQAEQNAGAFGWRLTAEEIADLENYPVTPSASFWNRFWQHG